MPLLFDLSAGTLRSCPDVVTLNLQPLRTDRQALELPSDRAAIDAIATDRIDLCAYNSLSRIIVSSGPLSQPQQILGQVRVGESDFREFQMPRKPENLDFLLRLKAHKLFGDKVDAIVNVGSQVVGDSLSYSYWKGLRTEEGSAFATGIAVQFTEGK